MKHKLVAILLAVLFLLNLAACTGSSEPAQGESEGESSASESENNSQTGFTEHELVRDGQTEYKIMIDPNAGNQTQYGAAELITFFKQATSVELEIETLQPSYSDDACYISIGDNSFSRSAGLADSGLDQREQGYHIETKGRSLFVCGGGDTGNLYGVYDLMHQLFGFEVYSSDEIAINTTLRLNVPELNYSDSPDFERRVIYQGAVIADQALQTRFCTVAWESNWTGVGGAHTSFHLLNSSREEHPDWYARRLDEEGNVVETYNQLCFTNEEVIERLTEAVIDQVDSYPDRSSVAVGIEDNRSVCLCPDCQKVMDQYNGCASASVIHAVNRIAAAVKDHLDKTDPGRKVTVVMFAYYGYLDAPVIDNGDGTYTPIDDTVVLADNVGIQIAPIDSDYAHSYYESDFNRSEIRSFKQWQALTKSIYLWAYSTNFAHYLAPYDAFNAMQENCQFLKECNVKYYYSQGNYSGRASGFAGLQNYLLSKLMWNVDADMDELLDGYFANYFREAGPAMRKYYDELRLHYAYLRSSMGVTGSIYYDIEKKEFWPYGLLQQWSGYIDEAYAAIEGYRESDPETYQKLYDRICGESISIRHLTAMLYKGMFNDVDYKAYTTALKDDMALQKITRYSEGSNDLPY